MKKNYGRRQFVKLATKVAIGSALFPGCAHKTKSKFQFRKISAQSDSYDYIVVGSGAGGGPVVARLVEAGFRVLLIEAGGSKSKSDIEIPAFHGLATEVEEFSWEFFVKHYEQNFFNQSNSKYSKENDGIFYPRATGLGGCTNHNAMITMYPDNEDWNYIKRLTNDSSWDASAMRKYFQKVENNQYYDEPHKSRSLMTLLNRERMGFKGWLSTEQTSPLFLLRDPKFIKVFLSALKEEGIINEAVDILADSKNIKLDPNTWSYVQNKLDGILNVPKATSHGKRISTRDLILNIKKKYPENLTIKTHTLAHKVIFDENNRAVGVEVVENPSENNLYEASPNYSKSFVKNKKTYKCHREVILAGGVFNSPQILMLSGIGEVNELSKHGIEAKVSLPGVGKNLQDRYEISVCSEMKEDFTLLKNCTFGKEGDPCLVDYRKDPQSSVYGTNGVISSLIKTSAGRKGDPDLFIFGLPGMFKGYYKGWSAEALKRNYFTWAILKGHTQNKSGTVTLKSSSPFERPEVIFRYFQDSRESYHDDLDALMEALEMARNINKRMKSSIKKEIYPGKDIKNYPELRNWIQKEAWGHHASCTNKIGADNDPLSVLDSKFRVRGTTGLRVVDASSFNKIPGLFIVLPIYMIAEKAAEDIISDAEIFE